MRKFLVTISLIIFLNNLCYSQFGRNSLNVKVYEYWILLNAQLKELGSDGVYNIRDDFKDFTTTDLKELAINRKCVLWFKMLLSLTKDAEQAILNSKDKQGVYDAKTALTYLSPKGKSWKQFSDMINQVNNENLKVIQNAYMLSIKDNIDRYLNDLIKLKLYPIDSIRLTKMADNLPLTEIVDLNLYPLEKEKLTKLYDSVYSVQLFRTTLRIALACADTEEKIDEITGKIILDSISKKPKLQYTKAALYAQRAFKQLDPNENWKNLYNIVFQVEVIKRAKIELLWKQSKKPFLNEMNKALAK